MYFELFVVLVCVYVCGCTVMYCNLDLFVCEVFCVFQRVYVLLCLRVCDGLIVSMHVVVLCWFERVHGCCCVCTVLFVCLHRVFRVFVGVCLRPLFLFQLIASLVWFERFFRPLFSLI